MNRNLHPTEGARFLLELTEETSGAATYAASIYTPDAVFSTTATLSAGGVAVLAQPTSAPGDLDDRLVNLAKLVARDAPPWPARILRWRKT